MFGRLLKNSPGQFPDLGLRVIASLLFSHLVESLGRDASILEQVQSKDYWIALLSGWLIAFFLWSQISMVSQHLDKRVDWMQEPLKRTSLQVLFGLVSPSIQLLVLTQIQFYIFWDQTILGTDFHLTEFPFGIVLIALINLVYFAWYLYFKANRPANEVSAEQDRPSFQSVIMVSSGKSQIPLDVFSIKLFAKTGEYVLIKTEERSYISTLSLDELELKLDPSVFFRANRQHIVNFSACKSIIPLEFGKLEIITEPKSDDAIVVSQKKQKRFKEWLANR